MTKSDEPRHVAMALIYSPQTDRLLMITSRQHPDLWIFPKGGIEKGETSGQAAVRESWEEAGTPPSLPAPEDEERLMMLALPSKKNGAVWHVHILEVNEDVVECIEQWPEKHERRRQWFTAAECLANIQKWTDVLVTNSHDNHSETPIIEEAKGTPAVQPDEQKNREIEESEKKSKKQQKKEKKAGAMECALRQFIELKGGKL
ncbi:uncharacterized protein I303_103827 [Kwoniella dejecticola CBS 10117]|uniref:Nudix hydrolase domain-containing protein n=1 Tax=Kwoniella dejecticola CBS 10117 TaxID=1296121 RepID=A0A1A6A7U3_9TREE|nr:uncharacterized protein I303_03846 [Kwoniella dejecticola CBS 10117]OBR86126.1 hypothetical protein I303_03846 [Kwoniella dejecticola CBS 10117]